MYTPEQQAALDEAGRLFGAGDAERSLALLRRLQSALPQDTRVAYSIALCHEHLGQIHEARALCDALLEAGPNPKVIELRQRLDTAGMGMLDDLLGPSAPKPPEHVKRGLSAYAPEPRQMVIGAALLLVACVGFALNQNVSNEYQQLEAIRLEATELPPPPLGSLAIIAAQWISLSFLSAAVGVFFALYIMDDVPGTDLSSAAPGVLTATAFLIPWLLIPVVGWVGVLVLVYRRYQPPLPKLAAAVGTFLACTGVGLGASTLLVMGMVQLLNSIML